MEKSIKEIIEIDFKNLLSKNPDALASSRGNYVFVIEGESGGKWNIEILTDGVQIQPLSENQAYDISIKLSEENFRKLLDQKLNVLSALLTGKIKIDGPFTKAMKLARLFN